MIILSLLAHRLPFTKAGISLINYESEVSPRKLRIISKRFTQDGAGDHFRSVYDDASASNVSVFESACVERRLPAEEQRCVGDGGCATGERG